MGAVLSAAMALVALPTFATEVKLEAPGASDELDFDLRAASAVIPAAFDPESRPSDILAAAQSDYARLTAVLYENARYKSVVRVLLNGREAAQMSALNLPREIRSVEIMVEPGPVFTFSRAEVAPLPPEAELPADFRVGAGATTPIMRSAVKDGVDAWRAAGHAKAEPGAQDITADHARLTVDARFRLLPGPKLRFGRLEINSPSAVRAARIRAIAGFPAGQVFAPEDMSRVATRLRRTGAFSSVTLREAETPNPDGTLDAVLTLQDAKPRRIGIGAELDTTDGLTLSGFWMHRNLTGAADRLRLEAEVSGIGGNGGGENYTLGATYTYPAPYGPDTALIAGATVERLNEPTYSSDVVQAGLEFEKIVSEKFTWSAGGGLRRSRTEDAFGVRDFNHVMLTQSLTWDSRDEELAPTRGVYADLEALTFVGFSGSETGLQLKADARTYFGFGTDRRTVLALRGQAGLVLGTTVNTTPPELLFFSGGGGTVRGQEYQSLGVPQAGTLVGGRGFLGLSAELRRQLSDKLGVVGFVDYGYVSSEADFSGTGESHSGIGIGARYFTPIGPIRVDLAVPLHNRNTNFVGLYIGIGHAF